MSNKVVVETVHGKYSKYEIVKDAGGIFSSPKFYVWKDGMPFKGSYSSLAAAVEAAKKAG